MALSLDSQPRQFDESNGVTLPDLHTLVDEELEHRFFKDSNNNDLIVEKGPCIGACARCRAHIDTGMAVPIFERKENLAGTKP